jgi:ArsR family transcriptional regulator, arsenate/arsenite/antimonite-responsive transcriptional repressor
LFLTSSSERGDLTGVCSISIEMSNGVRMNKNPDTAKLAMIMKALSNPNRLELLLEIAAASGETRYPSGCGDACECFVWEAVKRLKIGAPTVSHHLKELSRAGLIVTERRGKFLVARLNEEVVGEIQEVLAALTCRRV